VLKDKSVEQAFSGLPEDGWTWSVVQGNLTELCQAANKSMSWLLKVLHNYVLEEVATLRKTLEEGLRGGFEGLKPTIHLPMARRSACSYITAVCRTGLQNGWLCSGNRKPTASVW
jgi:hypothetical protein